MKPCDHILLKTIEITSVMLHLADEGDANREDIGCGVLYGVLRDSAYKIRRLAETEKDAHIRKARVEISKRTEQLLKGDFR